MSIELQFIFCRESRSRVHRSVSKPNPYVEEVRKDLANPYVEQLRKNLAKAKAKRARILKLLEELNSFKEFMVTKERDDDVVDTVSSLHQQLCAEVKAEAKQVKDASKQVQRDMLVRKQHVQNLLKDLLVASSPTQPVVIVNRTTTTVRAPTVAMAKKKIIKVIPVTATVKPPTLPPPPTTPPVRTRVAGYVDKERCSLCEELDDQEVCGDNGNTYRTMCHAVNCAGLALRDISTGACNTKV